MSLSKVTNEREINKLMFTHRPPSALRSLCAVGAAEIE